MTTLAVQERQQLTTLVREVGPDAPTLCDGWTVRDLVEHLVVREGSLALGTAVSALSRWLERDTSRRGEPDFEELVDRLSDGPPRVSLFGIPGADRVLNGVEFFVHHEDVRRAQAGWQPRALPPNVEDSLWRSLRIAGRLAALRAGVGLVAERAGTGDRVTLRGGSPAVVVCGAPAEVLLYVYGRREHARVELLGDDAALATLTSATLGT